MHQQRLGELAAQLLVLGVARKQVAQDLLGGGQEAAFAQHGRVAHQRLGMLRVDLEHALDLVVGGLLLLVGQQRVGQLHTHIHDLWGRP